MKRVPMGGLETMRFQSAFLSWGMFASINVSDRVQFLCTSSLQKDHSFGLVILEPVL